MPGFNAIGWPVRLSPSGPFIRDAVSDAPLLFGPGTIGIVLRAQGTSGAPQAITAGPTPVTGLTNVPCTLPGGYHYDLKVTGKLDCGASPQPNETVRCLVEYSTDAGLTWAPLPGRHNMQLACGPGTTIEWEEIDVDRTTAPNNATITNLRVNFADDGSQNNLTVQPGQCVLRVEQYIN